MSAAIVTALSILGLLVGVIGIVLTIAFYSKSRLAYQVRDFPLVGQPGATPYGAVTILFNDSAVPRVTVTQLAFWNAGKTTVRRADIVEKDPISLSFDKDTVILGSRALRASKSVNDVQLVLDTDSRFRALLTFDYLDRGDGAILEIMHTGSGQAKIAGSVRGFPKGVENWGVLQNWEGPNRSDGWKFIAVLAGVALLVFFINLPQTSFATRHPLVSSILFYIVITIIVLFGVLLISAFGFAGVLWVRTAQKRLPKSLGRKA